MCEEGHNDPPLFSFYLDTDGETIGIAVAMLGRVAELIRILCPLTSSCSAANARIRLACDAPSASCSSWITLFIEGGEGRERALLQRTLERNGSNSQARRGGQRAPSPDH